MRYESALFAKTFERPGPKSVSPANCSGVDVVVWWKWIVDMKCSFLRPEETEMWPATVRRMATDPARTTTDPDEALTVGEDLSVTRDDSCSAELAAVRLPRST